MGGDMDLTAERMLRILADRGITFLTDSPDPSRGSGIANTYILRHGGRVYVIDTACGAARAAEIRRSLTRGESFDILCTHYHNDHMANTGRIAGRGTLIYCHRALRSKIRYLRTNFTGQLLVMARRMDLPEMLDRFAAFPPFLVRLLVSLSRVSIKFPQGFLFAACYMKSWMVMGRITVPRRAVRYLEMDSMITLPHAGGVPGWEIAPGLLALETPGHTDCHISFYLPESRTLFAGDILNFLNPNDIQFGSATDTVRSLDSLREFVEREGVDLLLTGHLYPVHGTAEILALVDDVRNRHLHVVSAVRSVIGDAIVVRFQNVVDGVWALDDPLMRKLSRISFPRSTLIFLDVFILFVLEDMGFARGRDGSWYREKPD